MKVNNWDYIRTEFPVLLHVILQEGEAVKLNLPILKKGF